MHVHNNRRFGVDKIKIITRLGEITIKIMVLEKKIAIELLELILGTLENLAKDGMCFI